MAKSASVISPTEHALALARSQEEVVLHLREEFFNSLLEEWSRPPGKIDHMMQQSHAFFLPDFKSEDLRHSPHTIMIKDVPRGVLAASVTPPHSNFEHGGLRWVYSVMQAGDWLRYGVLIQGDPKRVMSYEQHHDHVMNMERIWDRQCDYQFRDSGGLLFEWRFQEPDFYSNFIYRERFKIIARHLHFRLGVIMAPLLSDPLLNETVAGEDPLPPLGSQPLTAQPLTSHVSPVVYQDENTNFGSSDGEE